MAAILNYLVPDNFYQKSNLQGVCVPIAVFVAQNEWLLRVFCSAIVTVQVSQF